MTTYRLLLLTLVIGGGVLTMAPAAAAQTADNVLLVVNDASAASQRIGEYYARKRGVPDDQVVHVTAPATDEISESEFQHSIEEPLSLWFSQTEAYDRILYIVLTKGVPLRVAGTGGMNGTVASVDSELTLLYRKLTGGYVTTVGRTENPYFAGRTPESSVKPFTHEAYDIFLVTRLDGFTVADAMAVVDRGVAPGTDGTFVLDEKATVSEHDGDRWLENAALRLGALGLKDRVHLDTSSRVMTGEQNVLGYYSWGSNDPAVKQRHFDLTFAPGALAAMFVSTDGRTFAEPPPGWNIGKDEDPSARFAGSAQSLAGDLIRDGATGVAGHVAEPFLDATVRPDMLFPAYVSGLNLAESFYSGIPFLSWQTVVIGDPLCAPFRTGRLSPEQIDPGPDPDTGQPRYFSTWRQRAHEKPPENEGA